MFSPVRWRDSRSPWRWLCVAGIQNVIISGVGWLSPSMADSFCDSSGSWAALVRARKISCWKEFFWLIFWKLISFLILNPHIWCPSKVTVTLQLWQFQMSTEEYLLGCSLAENKVMLCIHEQHIGVPRAGSELTFGRSPEGNFISRVWVVCCLSPNIFLNQLTFCNLKFLLWSSAKRPKLPLVSHPHPVTWKRDKDSGRWGWKGNVQNTGRRRKGQLGMRESTSLS